MQPQRVKGPLESVQDRVDDLASKIVYSILTSMRLQEIVDEVPDGITLEALKTRSPELYSMVIYSARNAILEKSYAS